MTSEDTPSARLQKLKKLQQEFDEALSTLSSEEREALLREVLDDQETTDRRDP